MPTLNDFGPAVDQRDPVLLRHALVKRVIYAIAGSEDPTDLVANTSGQVPIGLAYNGIVFWLDPDDTTSSHDGIAVLVTQDGYRYHASAFRSPQSVLAQGSETPPASPAIGDAYFLGAAPTGEWAGEGERIAVYTARGWVFVAPPVGKLFYVADGSRRWVYLDEAGSVVERFGHQPESIPDSAPIGGQRRYIVESQTLNDPPASPGLGVYWIIGPAPAGAWSGHAGKIATSYDGGATWTIITPLDGLEAYDRNIAANHIYRAGTGWVSAAGAWTRLAFARTAGTGSTTAPSGTTYWDGSATPTTGTRRRIDDVTIAFQASRSGALLKVRYHGNISLSLGTPPSTGRLALGVALYRDAEATAIDWVWITPSVHHFYDGGSDTNPRGGYPTRAEAEFFVTAPDAAAHTYRIALISRTMGSNQNIDVASVSRRVFSIEEAF
ncbi:MAG: DUF2793 domain-containing protein [Hyphomicrobiaceae bacterium]